MCVISNFCAKCVGSLRFVRVDDLSRVCWLSKRLQKVWCTSEGRLVWSSCKKRFSLVWSMCQVRVELHRRFALVKELKGFRKRKPLYIFMSRSAQHSANETSKCQPKDPKTKQKIVKRRSFSLTKGD